MSGKSAVSAKPPTPVRPKAAPAVKPRRAPTRRVAAGDVAPHLDEVSLQQHRVDRATDRTRAVQSGVLNDLVGAPQTGGTDPVEWLHRVQAMVDGASPDEAKALRRLLAERARPAQGPGPQPDLDLELAPGWRDGGYLYRHLMARKSYEQQKYRLQVELLKLQAWVKDSGQRVVILFEGRDAAGKRFMEHLNPRGARVVALEKPSEIERGQWYFQRYIEHLPTRGEIVLFDRSWYNRAGVERVMNFCTDADYGQWYFQRYIEHLPTRGEIVLFDRSWYNRAGVERVMNFCTDADYDEFLCQAPEFERHLVRSGVRLFKFWFSVSRAEQRRRFKERQAHPLKQWKLSPIDMASLDKWDDYTRAKESMFLHTDTSDAPWTVIKSNCKKRARLNAMRYLLQRMPYTNKDAARIGTVDPLLVGRASLVAGRMEEFGAVQAEA